MSFPRYPEYKDSGVEWLGEVPAHWGVSQSRRMFAVRSEPALESDEMLTASQKHGVLYQSDFVEREGRRVVEVILGIANLKHVEPDDFIISMRSFQGGIEWCKLRGSTSFHYVMLKPVKEVHPPFFAHLLKSSLYIQALRTTTDLIRDGQELRYSNFAQVDLPVVPLEEQAAIAKFLDRETAKIDALVSEQEKLIALLQEKRQAVISHAVTKGLDSSVPMKDSGVEWLEAVPGHWEVERLKNLADEPLKYGANEAAELDDPSLPRFVRITDVTESGALRDETFRSLPREIAEPFLLREGDVLLARSGATVGKSFMYERHWGEACFAGYLIRVRLSQRRCLPQWFNYFCRTDSYWVYVVGSQIQSTIQNVSAEKYANLVLPVPTLEEQRIIIAFLNRETAKLDTLTAEARTAVTLLQERRTALISAAVTGQIKVTVD
ncbi:restriction endonuclease subunit S [Acidovorax sp. BL-A-41-H1]|uniref:restriction endonuclease subunit S n=1 Tax=Acidovorax sp. BL-A-41-H1 TaxID=3421102 RepID=UPI003F7A2131